MAARVLIDRTLAQASPFDGHDRDVHFGWSPSSSFYFLPPFNSGSCFLSLSPIPINPGHCDSSSLLPYTAPSAASEKGMSTITMKVAYILEQARLPPGLPLGQCLLRSGGWRAVRQVFPLSEGFPTPLCELQQERTADDGQLKVYSKVTMSCRPIVRK